MIKKKPYLLLPLLLFLLVVPASADYVSFNVTVPSQPAWFLVSFNNSVTISNYSLNSTDTYASTSWELYGTNANDTFIWSDNRTGVSFNAFVEQAWDLNCTGQFKYYYLDLFSGFTNTSAFLNITLWYSEGSTATISVYDNTTKRVYDYWTITAICGLVVGTAVVIVKKRKKKKEG